VGRIVVLALPPFVAFLRPGRRPDAEQNRAEEA
jgi:hypothetical protein